MITMKPNIKCTIEVLMLILVCYVSFLKLVSEQYIDG